MSDLIEEKEIMWFDLEPHQKKMFVFSHARAFKTKKIDVLAKIFTLGNPKTVWGANNGVPYCRIHTESADVIKVLCRNYLK